MSEDHGKTCLPLLPSSLPKKKKKAERKQAAGVGEEQKPACPTLLECFLTYPNIVYLLPKAYQRGGHTAQDSSHVYVYIYVCSPNWPKSKPPQMAQPAPPSSALPLPPPPCSELLFGRSVVRFASLTLSLSPSASAPWRSVQAEVLIHFLLLFYKYVFYSRGETSHRSSTVSMVNTLANTSDIHTQQANLHTLPAQRVFLRGLYYVLPDGQY